jgi:hypothetical protein
VLYQVFLLVVVVSSFSPQQGSLGAAVKLLPCHHEVRG